MTRETKIGLVVASSFVCLVGVVVYSKMSGNTSVNAQQAANAPETPNENSSVFPVVASEPANNEPKALSPDIIRANNVEPRKNDPMTLPPVPAFPSNNAPLVSIPPAPDLPKASIDLPPVAAPTARDPFGPLALNNQTKEPLPAFPAPEPTTNPNNLAVKPSVKKQADLLAAIQEGKGTTPPPPLPPPSFGENKTTAPPLPPALPDFGKKPESGPAPLPPPNADSLFGKPAVKDIPGTPPPPNKGTPLPPSLGSIPPPSADDPFKKPTIPTRNEDPFAVKPPAPAPPIGSPPPGNVFPLDNKPAPPNIGNPPNTGNPPNNGIPPLGSANVPPVGALPLGNDVKPPTGPVKVSQVISDTLRAEDTDFDRLSRRLFNTDKYARALLEFNRDHPYAAPGIRDNPPRLQTGMKVFVPSAEHLEENYAKYLNMSAPRAIGIPAPVPNPGVGFSPPTSPGNFNSPPRPANLGQPTPLGQAVTTPSTAPSFTPMNPTLPQPAAESTKTYRVPSEGQHIIEIARDTLRDGNRWPEIFRLNPNIQPAQRIPGGTTLRMPGNAQVP